MAAGGLRLIVGLPAGYIIARIVLDGRPTRCTGSLTGRRRPRLFPAIVVLPRGHHLSNLRIE
jgi:hypothetical protein